MSEYCSDPIFCKDGNCIGCKDGQPWCQDPRCAPYCSSSICIMGNENDFAVNMVMIVILICLLTMFFIIWFVYGPRLFEHHDDHTRVVKVVYSN